MIRVRLVRKEDLLRDYAQEDPNQNLEKYLNAMAGGGYNLIAYNETAAAFRCVFKVTPKGHAEPRDLPEKT